MIRFFTKLCKRLLENINDEGIFKDATGSFTHYNEKCPSCNASMKLAPHGDYGRGLVSFEGEGVVERRIRPKRFKCGSCGSTHALLPDILIPYSPYSFRFQLCALIAYFKRDMTVVAICQYFGIAVSTLYKWKKLLISHKELFLGILGSQKEPALTFLHGLFESACLSFHLKNFFRQFAFSFMQATPLKAARNRPP